MAKPIIGIISGSTRSASINRKFAKAVAKQFDKQGAEIRFLDLDKYDMPIYNGDYEQEFGIPDTTKEFVKHVLECDGIFITTPEYNGSLPALLKNTIDWSSRTGLSHFQSPVYAIGAASPGPMSGIMALRELQFILARLGAVIIPPQIGAGNFETLLDEKGALKSGMVLDMTNKMVANMIDIIKER